MTKEISIRTINNVKECLYRIFDAEDDDCVNRKKVSANERAIDHYLKDYSEEQKKELLSIMQWHSGGTAQKLERLGWKIIREE